MNQSFFQGMSASPGGHGASPTSPFGHHHNPHATAHHTHHAAGSHAGTPHHQTQAAHHQHQQHAQHHNPHAGSVNDHSHSVAAAAAAAAAAADTSASSTGGSGTTGAGGTTGTGGSVTSADNSGLDLFQNSRERIAMEAIKSRERILTVAITEATRRGDDANTIAALVQAIDGSWARASLPLVMDSSSTPTSQTPDLATPPPPHSHQHGQTSQQQQQHNQLHAAAAAAHHAQQQQQHHHHGNVNAATANLFSTFLPTPTPPSAGSQGVAGHHHGHGQQSPSGLPGSQASPGASTSAAAAAAAAAQHMLHNGGMGSPSAPPSHGKAASSSSRATRSGTRSRGRASQGSNAGVGNTSTSSVAGTANLSQQLQQHSHAQSNGLMFGAHGTASTSASPLAIVDVMDDATVLALSQISAKTAAEAASAAEQIIKETGHLLRRGRTYASRPSHPWSMVCHRSGAPRTDAPSKRIGCPMTISLRRVQAMRAPGNNGAAGSSSASSSVSGANAINGGAGMNGVHGGGGATDTAMESVPSATSSTSNGAGSTTSAGGAVNGSNGVLQAGTVGGGGTEYRWAVQVLDRRHNHPPDPNQHLPVRYTREEEEEIMRLEAQGTNVDQIFQSLNAKRLSQGERVISSSRALRSKLNKLLKERGGGGSGSGSANTSAISLGDVTHSSIASSAGTHDTSALSNLSVSSASATADAVAAVANGLHHAHAQHHHHHHQGSNIDPSL